MRTYFLSGFIYICAVIGSVGADEAAPPPLPSASMGALDDKRPLNIGDRISYRVVEEQKELASLVVMASGEVEVPLIGRVHAQGKTCRQLAQALRGPLESEYFYKATVVISLDSLSSKSRGTIYVTGELRTQGPIDLPGDQTFTISKAIIRAGGFSQFANPRKVKVVRKLRPDSAETQTLVVDVDQIINHGQGQNDIELQPDDLVVVSRRLINF